ncbi:L-histidine N(alpha)-methyltransferase [Fibrella forsythiae]|uniref:L-histidine N(Alpha)-methyltransferase n=1 Tax=Fibrella forsythiae TaxID=2817061 RepID=A0ABS3JQB2_9BACT|nr:L-histidine N(alpha)-methyltransferase [Fibrella forsythiae]MBO0952177.1 L-histidine N(alpha)-methyltransferase [Fibrella forsythiae]
MLPDHTETTYLISTALADEVRSGLTQHPKQLSSRFFYDAEGSRLFSEIMHLPEYYLTRSEYEIIDNYKDQWLNLFAANDRPFDLIELGAGDGLKTKLLLTYFVEQGARFSYSPVDISETALDELTDDLSNKLPALTVSPQHGDYSDALARIAERTYDGADAPRRVVLFLGSNIGNFTPADALDFYAQLSASLRPGDLLLTGFDLQKHPAVIHAAYNDRQGLTKAFNLNLLRRINRELDADFNLAAFDHYETYSPETGEARSYLVSQTKQTVTIGALDMSVVFDYGEIIHTEISRKFTRRQIDELANQTGFTQTHWFTDCRHYFADVVYTKK